MNKKIVEKLIKYSDEYVAFIGDYMNIIASGKSMSEVEKQLKNKHIKDATITYIPPLDKSFTPICQ